MNPTRLRLVVVASGLLVGSPAAHGAVLCAASSGALYIRAACKPTETLVDPAAVGLQGTVCPPDSVKVANVCVDKWEASVWSIPSGNQALIDKVRTGQETLDNLTMGGATELSAVNTTHCDAPLFPATFPPNGNWTAPVYAASVPGVHPTACITWFQAEQACALSGKRLLTNQEWQRAAAGTPDPGFDDYSTTCTIAGEPSDTGSRAACVSQWGAYDMVGNVYEWVADWTQRAEGCTTWPGDDYAGDYSCFGGAGTVHLPAALARGGYFGLTGGVNSGVFDILGLDPPSYAVEGIGFRCARH
jgi:Sulfatase-modifying factor enzyme 1